MKRRVQAGKRDAKDIVVRSAVIATENCSYKCVRGHVRVHEFMHYIYI